MKVKVPPKLRRQKHPVEVGSPKFEDSITICLCDCLLAYVAVSFISGKSSFDGQKCCWNSALSQ